MTREEAIAYGNRVIGLGLNDETQAFCELAIKALEPCEDAISRKFFMRDLLLKAQGEKDVSIKWLEEYINSLPSVTPQPKTGHWIEEFNDLEGEVRFTCSSCGKYQLFGTDYCYNCGAKMVEPQVESEE